MQFFLFNPQLGGEADAEKKILYYYPPDTPLKDQVGSVGLCEAIAAFSQNFSNAGCESLHTQNGRLISWQAEPDFFAVLCMPHSTDNKPDKGKSAASASSPAAAASKDAGGGYDMSDTLPQSEEAMQDCTLMALLKKIYGALRLACGPLQTVATTRGTDGLRALLGDVMPLLIRVAVPAGEEDGRRLDLLDTIEGMKFLVVDRRVYLRAQYLLNLVLTSHACVKHALLMHHDQLVWSSLSRDATQQVHRAVAHLVAPSLQIPTRQLVPFDVRTAVNLPDEALLFAVSLAQRQLRSVAKPPPAAGGFVCGAGDVSQDGRSELQHAALAMLVDEESTNWMQPLWYNQLAQQLVPELQPLAQLLSEAHAELATRDDAHRFLYFNQMNNVLKSSIKPMRAGLTGRLGLHTEPKNLLNRLHADLTDGEHGVREVALQTAGAHGWLVGQASGRPEGLRGFYLLLDGLDCSWSEVHQEVTNLCATRFAPVFLE